MTYNVDLTRLPATPALPSAGAGCGRGAACHRPAAECGRVFAAAAAGACRQLETNVGVAPRFVVRWSRM